MLCNVMGRGGVYMGGFSPLVIDELCLQMRFSLLLLLLRLLLHLLHCHVSIATARIRVQGRSTLLVANLGEAP